MWFVLERLDPMPVETLQDAGRMLVDGLRRMAPDAAFSIRIFDAERREGEPEKITGSWALSSRSPSIEGPLSALGEGDDVFDPF